jgi:hypothetical protein
MYGALTKAWMPASAGMTEREYRDFYAFGWLRRCRAKYSALLRPVHRPNPNPMARSRHGIVLKGLDRRSKSIVFSLMVC